MEKKVQMPTKQEILEYVSKTLSEDNRDENLKKLIEILKRLVIESGNISSVELSDRCPALIYGKGTTNIKIIMPDYPRWDLQWHRLYLEFCFSIDEKIYILDFEFKFSMQDCRDIKVSCGPADENNIILRDNIEYFECKFTDLLWKVYNGCDGNLKFPNKNNKTFTTELHRFKIDDFIKSLEYAINYNAFSGIVNLNFVDSKDMGKHLG